MSTEIEYRECPFCMEDIKVDAIKCKHCGSSVKPESPPHGGTCPFCKEEIKAEAIRCKHCGSMVGGSTSSIVGGSTSSGCCGGCADKGHFLEGVAGAAPFMEFLAANPVPASPEASMTQKPFWTCSDCMANGYRICCVHWLGASQCQWYRCPGLQL